MSTFSEKARSTQLRRTNSTPAGAGIGLAATLQGQPSRCLASLGEPVEEIGAKPKAARASDKSLKAKQRRLPPGGAALWERSSKLHIVRELFDGYAADPLGEAQRHVEERGIAAAPPHAAASQRSLERYADRQAKIEKLLENHTSTARVDFHKPAPPAYAPARPTTGASDDTVLTGDAYEVDLDADSIAPQSFMTSPAPPDPIAGAAQLTRGVSISERIVRNGKWSGGVLFKPPNPTSFRLTICPEQDVGTSPVFIGIAPAGANLEVPNFHDTGTGVFLCMGGLHSDALIAALGAPGGPSFHFLGDRHQARLPMIPLGGTVSVHYSQTTTPESTVPIGELHFITTDPNGVEFVTRPPLPTPLPADVDWRPCVLLCMPTTAVRISTFI